MILRIVGCGKDCFSIGVDHGRSHTGYLPYDLGLGGGDYIRLEIDVDTGRIIDWDPVEVKETLRDLKLLP